MTKKQLGNRKAKIKASIQYCIKISWHASSLLGLIYEQKFRLIPVHIYTEITFSSFNHLFAN